MHKNTILIVITIFLASCNGKLPETNDDAIVTNNHISYFGFAVIDCGWDDPSDNVSKTNYIDEIAGFANVGQMCVYSPSESLSQRLTAFTQANVKAILHVEAILFEQFPDTATPTGIRVELRLDAKERWEAFLSINQNELTLDNITAIYIVDEPVWNSVSLADFETALEIVKSTLPEIPAMSIEAYPVLDQVMVPETLDWIGFDRYDSIDPANDSAWLADLETIRSSRTRLDQKIVIVASTQWLPYYQADAGVSPSDMAAIIESYYQVAVSHPDVIALVGYLWPGGLDDPKQLGARSLPDEVQQTMKEIGLEIINR